jgi:hypothetical protein
LGSSPDVFDENNSKGPALKCNIEDYNSRAIMSLMKAGDINIQEKVEKWPNSS